MYPVHVSARHQGNALFAGSSSSDEGGEMKKRRKPSRAGKRRAEGDIRHGPGRPMNAFMLWQLEHRTIVQSRCPGFSNNLVSMRLGELWRELSVEDRVPFSKKAKQIKQRHKVVWPKYRYRSRATFGVRSVVGQGTSKTNLCEAASRQTPQIRLRRRRASIISPVGISLRLSELIGESDLCIAPDFEPSNFAKEAETLKSTTSPVMGEGILDTGITADCTYSGIDLSGMCIPPETSLNMAT